jgi:16S rRNA (cytosine1402-N4)-methyltransferase
VYGIDRDPNAKIFAENLSHEFPGRFAWLVGNFADMCALLAEQGVEAVDGIVLDLGISSMQIDQPERGFSFRHDGPLDMRMAQSGMSAADFLNSADEADIADVLYTYGEERMSRRIAKAIVAARAEKPIERTQELAALVKSVVGYAGDKDPATRTFQGLRIHINDELSSVTRALEAAEKLLKPGGRLVVVTFHSLEDRLVKRFTHSRCGKFEGASRHVPQARGAGLPSFSLPRPEKIKVSDAEAKLNPRSRSATLRAAIRTDAPVMEVRL